VALIAVILKWAPQWLVKSGLSGKTMPKKSAGSVPPCWRP
jgi:hypothetical protein